MVQFTQKPSLVHLRPGHIVFDLVSGISRVSLKTTSKHRNFKNKVLPTIGRSTGVAIRHPGVDPELTLERGDSVVPAFWFGSCPMFCLVRTKSGPG